MNNTIIHGFFIVYPPLVFQCNNENHYQKIIANPFFGVHIIPDEQICVFVHKRKMSIVALLKAKYTLYLLFDTLLEKDNRGRNEKKSFYIT